MPRKTKTKAALIGVFAMVFGSVPAVGADLKGPAELPPPAYQGQQYVDSKGCVFLRAGFGGQVTWVPRITRDRKQMCGYPPSGQRVEVASAEQAPDVKPAPKSTGTFVATAPLAAAKPSSSKTTAPQVQPVKPPVAVLPKPAEKPAKVKQPKEAALPKAAEASAYRITCPPEAPFPKSFALRDGGSQIFCTKDGHSLSKASAPFSSHQKPLTYVQAETLPAGYVPVWEDDRLNPYRGPRSATGDAAMAQIWTDTIPAQERKDLPKRVYLAPQELAVAPQPVASVSGKYRVQVGSFAQAGNADRLAGRLASMGYAVSKGSAKGGRLQVIYAGPFASGAEAQSALQQIRAAGYSDAILAR